MVLAPLLVLSFVLGIVPTVILSDIHIVVTLLLYSIA